MSLFLRRRGVVASSKRDFVVSSEVANAIRNGAGNTVSFSVGTGFTNGNGFSVTDGWALTLDRTAGNGLQLWRVVGGVRTGPIDGVSDFTTMGQFYDLGFAFEDNGHLTGSGDLVILLDGVEVMREANDFTLTSSSVVGFDSRVGSSNGSRVRFRNVTFGTVVYDDAATDQRSANWNVLVGALTHSASPPFYDLTVNPTANAHVQSTGTVLP